MLPAKLAASSAPLVLALAAAAQLPAPVNAPVAPEAVYVGVRGATPGISVIDMNGFGQGTGSLTSTRFPLNPNVGQPGVVPSLAPGTSTLDAGSAGVLTYTRDALGSPLLARPPRVGAIGDMCLGQPLDLIFHNERINLNAQARNHVNPALMLVQPGNTIMVAPHPNPPRLVLPPPNPGWLIFCEEPTVTTSGSIPGRVTTQAPPNLPSPMNLLVTGNPFSNQIGVLGLFGVNFDRVFVGPQPPPISPPPPLPFAPYTCRQQIGHFLYAIDRDAKQVVVLNSNNFLVLLTIPLPDPTSMAMAPNLKLLAVSNFATNTVSLLDVDPLSPTTRRVVATIPVPAGPGGLAWQPEGEDLLVCAKTANALAAISATTLSVRKTTTLTLSAPLEVAVTARQVGFAFNTGTWFAYVLNSDGRVSIYESGPSIIGPDDVITEASVTFPGARTLQPDLSRLNTGCWITHRDPSGLGQVSRIELTSSPYGPLPYVPPANESRTPDSRQRTWTVVARYGGSNATTPIKDRFSGNDLVDFAFDDILNLGAFPDARSPLYSGLGYALHSGKGQVKITHAGLLPTHSPYFILTACADTGKVDAVEINTGKRLATLDTPGVSALCHYWRQ